MTEVKLAIIWERFGEYHHARLEAASRFFDLHGIEIVSRDMTYAWAPALKRDGYHTHTLMNAAGQSVANRWRRNRLLNEMLDRIAPSAIAVPGWSFGYAIAALNWARERGVPTIMMSDSNAFDDKRRSIAELIKKCVVSGVQSGFVSGSSAKAYLASVGLPETEIVMGYDVVDNDHFRRSETDRSVGDASNYFLAAARFVPRKNLNVLISAYGQYVAGLTTGQDGWPLVILGDGEQRPQLERQVEKLGLSQHVRFAGFVDYPGLPAYYHGAGVFILPSLVEQWGLVVNEAMAAGLPVIVSKNCGCTDDLVAHGRNGFTFDPSDAFELHGKMRLLSDNPSLRKKMGRESSSIISHWGLDRFATGLSDAAAMALKNRSGRASPICTWVTRLLGVFR